MPPLEQSILDVGVHEAARQLFSSEGRGFNSRAFDERDGGFFHEQRSGGCGAREPAAKAPTAGASVETESEVEVKFQPPPHLASELERRGAEGVRKVFTDTYFDTAAATLTTRDHWLRLRSGVIELKRPNTDAAAARAESELRVDFYTEERAWPAISAALAKLGVELATQVPPDAYGVTAALERAGVAPFAVLTTARTRFAATLCGHDVHVDLDEVTFGGELPATRGGTEGGGAYAVGEVELVKAAPGTAPREALRQVLAELGVQAAAAAGAAPQVRGKVLEYIYRYDERRWRALGASGLLAEKLGA